MPASTRLRWTPSSTTQTSGEVEAAHIRLRPPACSPSVVLFQSDQPIEALHGDVWWSGIVSSEMVIEGRPGEDRDRKYIMRLGTGEVEWVQGEWVEPAPQIVQSMEYIKGTLVEVCSDEEGFRGAWFTAKIMESLENNMFLVEYLHLTTDDEMELLKETVDALYIRSIPPQARRDEKFKKLEVVDARYNDGWWVGVISKVLDRSRYIVYFRTSMEEIEFGQKELRIHHEWVDGKWLRVSKYFT